MVILVIWLSSVPFYPSSCFVPLFLPSSRISASTCSVLFRYDNPPTCSVLFRSISPQQVPIPGLHNTQCSNHLFLFFHTSSTTMNKTRHHTFSFPNNNSYGTAFSSSFFILPTSMYTTKKLNNLPFLPSLLPSFLPSVPPLPSVLTLSTTKILRWEKKKWQGPHQRGVK